MSAVDLESLAKKILKVSTRKFSSGTVGGTVKETTEPEEEVIPEIY